MFALASFQDDQLVRFSETKYAKGALDALCESYHDEIWADVDPDYWNVELFASWTQQGYQESSFSYVNRNKRIDPLAYTIKRFKEDPLLTWEPGRTEKELAELNGLARIWDAGKIRYKKKKER